MTQRRSSTQKVLGGAVDDWWETDPNLIAWWPFTSDANDYSGNGYNGTLQGNANISGSPAMLQTDGNGDYVNWAQSSPDIWHNAISGFTLIGFFANTSTVGPSILFDFGGSDNGFTVGWRSGPQALCFATSQASNNVEAQSTTTIDSSGDIHMFAAVYDNGSMKLYIDGVLEDSDTNGTSIGANGEGARIGYPSPGTHSLLGGSTNYWKGSIGELAFYSRAFNGTEVGEVFNGKKAYFGL